MKTLKLNKLMLPMLLLVSSAAFISCSEETVTPDPSNEIEFTSIVDVAKANDFNILLDALDRVDLTSTLDAEGSFTVFAPTDQAFTDLLAELNLNSLDDVPNEVLKEILLNHVVGTEVMSTALNTGYVNSMASGAEDTKVSMYIDTQDGVKINNRSTVTQADVDADNGVVHVIDKVILIPSIVDIALSNPNFSILVSALTNENLSADFVSILSGDGPFTVFAPTNDAFTALLNSNMDWNSLSDIPTATLEAVLSYHVIAGSNVTAGEITDGSAPQTYQGTSVTLNVSNNMVSITDGQSNNADVIIADVQGSNGVIHAINKVLIP